MRDFTDFFFRGEDGNVGEVVLVEDVRVANSNN
jgi:hypothetical protein